MYSPKISEDLIPFIYQLAKQQGREMTQVVDKILRNELVPETPVPAGRILEEVKGYGSQALKVETSAEEMKALLKGKRFTLKHSHKFCLHNFSNTLVMTESGRSLCHSCYL